MGATAGQLRLRGRGTRRFFNSGRRQRRPGRPDRSHLPRGSAPHSCPGLYLTSGPRPESPRHAVHRIRQCPASRAPAPPRWSAPLHSAPFNPRGRGGARGGARAPPPRPPPAPPPRAAPTPPPRAAGTRSASPARRPPRSPERPQPHRRPER